jgi:hypothetical protein
LVITVPSAAWSSLGAEGEGAKAMIRPKPTPKSRWRDKIHRPTEDGSPVCGAVRKGAGKTAPTVTSIDADVTCGRCRRMLRFVEIGMKAKRYTY